MAELPEMAPADADHIIRSTAIIRKVSYQPGRIEYQAFEPAGQELLRLTFKPKAVFADGKTLPKSGWKYGRFRGVPGVLQIFRKSANEIVVIGK
jgi:hypothetical protein